MAFPQHDLLKKWTFFKKRFYSQHTARCRQAVNKEEEKEQYKKEIDEELQELR